MDMKTTPSMKALLIVTFFFLAACGHDIQTVMEELPNESLEQPGIEEPIVEEPTGPNGNNPVMDGNFTTLPGGKSLGSISVSGSKLTLAKGTGTAFTSAKKAEYENLKRLTQTDPAHKVQWTFMDLDARRVIARSLSADKKIFGASSSKIYVAAALLDQQNGQLSASQLQLMADMLVVSSNTAWTNLQSQIGGGSADKGRERIHNFTQRMGYPLTRGYQGYWGKIHGNELVPDETVETLYDIYTNKFPGAETLWKLMHTCRTGSSRGRKYIPSNIYVGGKTGTYDGPTENPATGATYNVAIRNHILVFNVGGRQYGLVVYANSGSDESAALLAGGLLREYTGVN